jgi:hypothetical protein
MGFTQPSSRPFAVLSTSTEFSQNIPAESTKYLDREELKHRGLHVDVFCYPSQALTHSVRYGLSSLFGTKISMP